MTHGAAQHSWLDAVAPDEMRRIVDALYRVHQLQAQIVNRDALLSAIIEESKAVAGAEACSLLLFDEDAEELYFHVTLGDSGDQQALKRTIRLSLGQGIAGEVAQSRVPVCVNDAQSDPRLHRAADAVSQFVTRSLLALPLVDEDRLLGVLEVLNKSDQNGFSDTDMRVMEMFSSLTASTLTRARLVAEKVEAERMAAVGHTVAGLSHYTKNLLAGVTTGMEFFDEGLAADDMGILRQGWPVLRRSVERIRHVVEDMLAFSKPRTPLYEDCDVSELCRDAAEAFDGITRDSEGLIDLRLERAPARWRMDSRGIFRCLLNLLVNAADAAPPDNRRVRFMAVENNGKLLLIVEDNGPGVPEEECLKIFEPFYSTKGAQGTGLGLAVTRKVVQEHAGTLTVERSELGGACFTIALPREGA